MARSPLSPTSRSTIRRLKDRAATDRAELDAVLDAGLVCHLALILDGAPVVLPTGYGREGDTVYLHGSSGARSLRTAADGVEIAMAVTLLDGIVYARSVMHHSMNYRSAVIHGSATPLASEEDKLRGLRVITEHLAPGSWEHARLPTRRELAATAVLALDLTEAAVKIRTGPPGDDPEDIAADQAWAGVLPIHQTFGIPQPCPQSLTDRPVPPHISARGMPA